MGKTSKQLLAKALGGGVAAPAVPASCRRAQELFAQVRRLEGDQHIKFLVRPVDIHSVGLDRLVQLAVR
jgi:hypothetical protein